jgi:S1-C subfamily serine protease
MPMAQGLGFSVPLDTLKAVVARFAQKRSTTGGVSMGVGGMRAKLDSTLMRSLNITQQYGMEVLEIRSDSPAYHAELKRLDVIINADGDPVTEPQDLQRIVRRHRSGEKISVSFLRGGKLRKVTVVL